MGLRVISRRLCILVIVTNRMTKIFLQVFRGGTQAERLKVFELVCENRMVTEGF